MTNKTNMTRLVIAKNLTVIRKINGHKKTWPVKEKPYNEKIYWEVKGKDTVIDLRPALLLHMLLRATRRKKEKEVRSYSLLMILGCTRASWKALHIDRNMLYIVYYL